MVISRYLNYPAVMVIHLHLRSTFTLDWAFEAGCAIACLPFKTDFCMMIRITNVTYCHINSYVRWRLSDVNPIYVYHLKILRAWNGDQNLPIRFLNCFCHQKLAFGYRLTWIIQFCPSKILFSHLSLINYNKNYFPEKTNAKKQYFV